MADREVRYLFRNKKTSGSTLPNNYMVGEPFVNVYEGRMFFYGVEGGSYTPANGQTNVFEVGSNVGTLNAGVILSAGTNLYDIFLTEAPPEDFTRVQNGLNTYTGGTDNFPTVNVSAATLDNLSVSGVSSLGVVSATTIISGSTNLYDIFKMYSEDIILLSGSSWDSTAYTQTVAITSTTISDEAIIWVSPKNTRTDIQNYIDSEIIAVNNIFSAITFECVSIPTVNINVNIVIKNQ